MRPLARGRLADLTHLRERAESAGVTVRVEEQHGDPAGLIELYANARVSISSLSLGCSSG